MKKRVALVLLLTLALLPPAIASAVILHARYERTAQPPPEPTPGPMPTPTPTPTPSPTPTPTPMPTPTPPTFNDAAL